MAMAENINRVLDDDNLYDSLVNEALSFSRKFNWKIIAEDYAKAAEKAVERNKG